MWNVLQFCPSKLDSKIIYRSIVYKNEEEQKLCAANNSHPIFAGMKTISPRSAGNPVSIRK